MPDFLFQWRPTVLSKVVPPGTCFIRPVQTIQYRDFFSGNDRNISLEVFDIFHIFAQNME